MTLKVKRGGVFVPVGGASTPPPPAVVAYDCDSYSSSATSQAWGPLAYVDGDLLVMSVMHRRALTTPSGWTLHSTASVPYGDTVGQSTSILSRRMTGAGSVSGTVVQASAQRLIVDVYVLRGAGTPISRADLLLETDAKLDVFSFTVPGKGATSNLVVWALSAPYWSASAEPNPPFASVENTPWMCQTGMWSGTRAAVAASSNDNNRLGTFFDYAIAGERTFTSTSTNADDWVALVALEIPGITT